MQTSMLRKRPPTVLVHSAVLQCVEHVCPACVPYMLTRTLFFPTTAGDRPVPRFQQAPEAMAEHTDGQEESGSRQAVRLMLTR